ncbi:MAG: hypothetical protein WAT39_01070 [Planctomycetota bacterium]
MPTLNPTPADRLVDAQGRPYFLWDVDMTRAQFEQHLRTGDRETRAYLVGKMMRQAKPDDVFTFVSRADILDLWPDLQMFLGRSKPFWEWLVWEWKK